MPLRRRAWLTREGWYYVAVLVFVVGGSVLRSVNLLVILAGMMIAPLLFNWRLVMASLMGLVVRRRLPEQFLAGESLTVEISVTNTRWWMSSWLLAIEDTIQRQPNPGQAGRERASRQRPAVRGEALILQVPAHGQASGTYRVTLPRRGRYRFGPLRVSTRFPLGLVRGQITLPETAEMLVAPRLGQLLPAWTRLLESETAGDQQRHPQQGYLEGDYYGLRPWQCGDSVRWIHWRTSAKLGRPVVRQFERRSSREVALVLDPWRPADPAPRDQGRLELAISLAASGLVDLVNRGHARLSFAVAGPAPRMYSGPASHLFCQEVLAELAVLASDPQPDLAAALRAALDEAPRDTRLIVISSRAADAPSLHGAAADLPLDPDDLAWIDAGSSELANLFVLT